MRLNKIEIKFVKGIEHLVINQPIEPNRPNVLVAPNGFGKTSISSAFKSLTTSGIVLDAKNLHKGKVSGTPSISITQSNGVQLVADDTHNDISANYSIFVVSSPLKPRATVQIFGKRHNVNTYMDIEPTIVLKSVPKKIDFDYDYSAIRTTFGNSKKVLPNISVLYTNVSLIRKIEAAGINFHTFDLLPYKKAIKTALDAINSWGTKTTVQIAEEFTRRNIGNIGCSDFTKLCSIISEETSFKSKIQIFLASWQYILVRSQMKANFSKAVDYAKFLAKKKILDKTLCQVNPVSDRFSIISKVEDRKLVIHWPEANMISSGQRDSMVFISKLIECEYQSVGNCILVIDEFFDYLDDANLVVFQYYVSTLIDGFRKSKRLIFPILLTHLDPGYLKHFCFNDKRLNVCYLKPTLAKVSKELMKFVQNREEESIKNDIDKYYFHYHPDIADVDITEKLEALILNKDWGRAETFKNKVDRQLRAYVIDHGKYDPLAVCFSVRIRIEELTYKSLTTEEQRRQFLNTHGTNEKLQYAQSVGVSVPETYYLLGIIYNHPLHDICEESAKSLGMKLDNPALMKIIRSLWP